MPLTVSPSVTGTPVSLPQVSGVLPSWTYNILPYDSLNLGSRPECFHEGGAPVVPYDIGRRESLVLHDVQVINCTQYNSDNPNIDSWNVRHNRNTGAYDITHSGTGNPLGLKSYNVTTAQGPNFKSLNSQATVINESYSVSWLIMENSNNQFASAVSNSKRSVASNVPELVPVRIMPLIDYNGTSRLCVKRGDTIPTNDGKRLNVTECVSDDFSQVFVFNPVDNSIKSLPVNPTSTITTSSATGTTSYTFAADSTFAVVTASNTGSTSGSTSATNTGTTSSSTSAASAVKTASTSYIHT